jgi:hypothetical protein
MDGSLLLLVDAAGHGDEHKPEWVKALLRFRVQSLLWIWRSGRQTSSPFNQIRFLDITAL